MTKTKKKGFTLIELLVVIAIIAVLSVVVVLTLNPAEMLRRSRDADRASDLSIIKTSISLYLADVSTTNMGTAGTCYIEYSGASAPANTNGVYEFATSTTALSGTATAVPDDCSYWDLTDASVANVSSSRVVSGGWIPLNLNGISSGPPIGQWPVDPSYSIGANLAGNGNGGHFYSYIATSTNNAYKVTAKMESALYSQGGVGDFESSDGGVDNNIYEQGTNLSL